MNAIRTSEAVRVVDRQSIEDFDMRFDMRASKISDALHRWAIEHSGGMLWLAVDTPTSSADPLRPDLEAAIGGPSSSPVRVRHPVIDRASGPRWLPLNVENSAGSALLRQSIERALIETDPERLRRGHGRRIAGWLALDGDLFDAQEHWAAQMSRWRPDCGAKRCLVRLHDPAVLWALWHVLRPEQRGDLLGRRVSDWWLLDPAGHLVRLQRPAIATLDSMFARAWRPPQWEDIDNIKPLNGALRQWLCAPQIDGRSNENGGRDRGEAALLSREGLVEAIGAAFPAMRRGRAAGFVCMSDMVLLATLAMTVHPRFDEHPLYIQAVGARNGDETLRELAQSLADADLQTIRRDLSPGSASEHSGQPARQLFAARAAGI
jgi:hypothetical protein